MQIRIDVRMPSVSRDLRAKLDAIVPTALNALAAVARDRLVASAQKNLRGFAQREYVRGLTDTSSIEIRESSAIVRLVGDYPSAIEQGASSYDIKRAMLAKATKRTADGKPYVDVPMRHGVEEDAVNIQGMPTGVAQTMQQAVRQAQQALVASGTKPQDAKMATVRSAMRTSPQTVTKQLAEGGTLTTTHKRGIWDDMLRVPKMYAKAIQSTYMTIRRISENSDPSSWIHPGFKPAKLFDEVVAELQTLAPRVVEDVVRRAL